MTLAVLLAGGAASACPAPADAVTRPGPIEGGAACEGRGPARAELEALKAGGWVVADDGARQRLALGLLDCLGHPDPAVRDGIAYAALAHWLRADALDLVTRRTMLVRLQRELVHADFDGIDMSCVGRPAALPGPGFRAPFAALVLSEVARTDRFAPWLDAGQRAELVEVATSYVAAVRDWRGFDETEGWRHGVAHGADLLMQLALNPALEKPQLDAILGAVASQVAPPGHFYVYGESERLARPVLFVLQRGQHDDADWRAWLERVAAPAPMTAWSDAFTSQTGLAKRHDTRAFLLALHVYLATSGDPALAARAAAVADVLRTID
ncbi:DUF2785 domain-containing protein [Arenimonas composti]|uniref:DUF2785 domain-containing protein n=1 Tax=Arenimonas composti TR7-09 = DSM 18010 TaxID=1121013 RepID=A0A091BA80_9GAMM|nr:DUF2785 domain-containing protein [Arenimonas composti]KFN48641.1 hypothetical protein P873_14170 [Arenimonas composti TR7-09 = DSM 18010]